MTVSTQTALADSAAVRDYLMVALRQDLIGPGIDDEFLQQEKLLEAPSRAYLTGFLVPSGAPPEQRARDLEEEPDQPGEPAHGADDGKAPERGSGKRVYLPSSMGLSVLLEPLTARLEITLHWGDYAPQEMEANRPEEEANPIADDRTDKPVRPRRSVWVRSPHTSRVTFDLASFEWGQPTTQSVPESEGLEAVCLVRQTRLHRSEEIVDALAASVFVVNRRTAIEGDLADTRFAFQVEMTVESDRPFLKRYDPRGLKSEDWDERLADLHYRDVAEYAVGHNVSVRADGRDGECRQVRTTWTPVAAVERVESAGIPQVEFGMEALGTLSDSAEAQRRLEPLISAYRAWIQAEDEKAQTLAGRRREVADELVRRANVACQRMEAGIDLLDIPDVWEAFRIANRAMAAAARRRIAQEQDSAPATMDPPRWRPFQLAYLLMNLRGIAEPTHVDREMVDLLFFPTGGGKTEAYLGLAAFTLVLRRLRDPDPIHRGLSVLMRYTLRLLTLDQLGRAAALMCALELEREADPSRLGNWPFEIGLWVGRAATPNHMGQKGHRSDQTARTKALRFSRDTTQDPPLPLEQCPWCGTKFGKRSFQLYPDIHHPTDLWVFCANRHCDFSGNRHLPIVAVDEPIYRRLPAFLIATVDKFAALPWTGETAGFFRGGDPDHPRPPDLIIQDELHLISGPLGTMAGLYETAIDQLCQRQIDGQTVSPKIVASTATVRLAQQQIRALFGRQSVAVFPSPGIDRQDAFFARQASRDEVHPRLYLGIAAQGRGPKLIFLRCAITLMAAAQVAWDAASQAGSPNPADPYMTVVAYFNALRELGSARRIVEDEISSRLQTYGQEKRLNGLVEPFVGRKIAFEPVELTSRVSTALVADAKRRLSLDFGQRERVDIALATNMISVGLDISRLGLMLVSGQPKSTSEYIQATSRVGRDAERPGLVVTLLNMHRPRDRSHYERFTAWHESFYRGVEATGATPFAPRALDRGLPAVTIALARLGIPQLTGLPAASAVERFGPQTKTLAKAIGERAQGHATGLPDHFGDHVTQRVQSLIDDWAALAEQAAQDGVTFGYTSGRDDRISVPLLREMIDPDRATLSHKALQFRAPRSLRDVEPCVLLGIKTPEGQDIP